MAPFVKPTTIPLIPLPYSTVLLPGVVLRIFISERHDITSLLNKLSNNSSTLDASNIAIGCVPLKVPASLNTDDKKRLVHEEGDEVEASPGMLNIDPSSATAEDLFTHGTVARIVGLEGHTHVGLNSLSSTSNGVAVVVEGVSRFRIKQFRQRTPWYEADVQYFIDEPIAPNDEKTTEQFARLKALSRELVALLRMNSTRGVGLPPMVARRLEVMIAKRDANDAGALADFMVSAVEATLPERLEFLAAVTVPARIQKAVAILGRQVEKIKNTAQKRSHIMPVPHLIVMDNRKGGSVKARPRRGPPGMGDTDDEDSQENDEVEELAKRLQEVGLSPEAEKVAKRELQRLKRMSPVQAEYGVCRTYLETLAEIPWSKTTDDQLDNTTLSRARKQLDDDHYGLEKIKKRLLEYLAVLRLKRQIELEKAAKEVSTPSESAGKELVKASDVKAGKIPPQNSTPEKLRIVDKSPILLLVGPPGTGKTSLAKSVATALGRKFHRISLGGVRDEAEIRGHRRTYVAAMPGVIVNGLKKVGVANPVILLDEIDKLGGANFHGDPSAAMLEVLDPEQNWNFVDHYINIPIDLSKVLFIATANSLDTIPAPLLDRMETIQLSGYTSMEKKHIASQYLIPKQLQSNGLEPTQVNITEPALAKIILSYTRESGVRSLEREIGSVCRAKAVEFSEAKDSDQLDHYKPMVDVADLEAILGIEKYDLEIAERSMKPGVVTGLVAYSIGGTGSILFIESSYMPGTGRLQLTGKLGDVIKESVEVALTWVRAHAYTLGLTHDPDEDLMKNKNVHIHLPAGAVPKDGPSAGMAFAIGIISLFSGRKVPPTIAMTGEFSLRGKVTAVGGIKEKLIGALSAGVKTVLLPATNKKEARDLPQEVKDGLEILFVRNIYEALKYVWPDWTIGDQNITAMESRL
ncbi:ATP-dependent protease La [Ascodesmis nigricans]|uniref:Lon protease homolog 2, peroxisomal n=1 Tax=Ascodesmis nigricans TaxID=341454 RepID=A0A4S2MW79_9PEZI|nr:ATP-dependent protease La [Ascodesmis nigricans]